MFFSHIDEEFLVITVTTSFQLLQPLLQFTFLYLSFGSYVLITLSFLRMKLLDHNIGIHLVLMGKHQNFPKWLHQLILPSAKVWELFCIFANISVFHLF